MNIYGQLNGRYNPKKQFEETFLDDLKSGSIQSKGKAFNFMKKLIVAKQKVKYTQRKTFLGKMKTIIETDGEMWKITSADLSDWEKCFSRLPAGIKVQREEAVFVDNQIEKVIGYNYTIEVSTQYASEMYMKCDQEMLKEKKLESYEENHEYALANRLFEKHREIIQQLTKKMNITGRYSETVFIAKNGIYTALPDPYDDWWCVTFKELGMEDLINMQQCSELGIAIAICCGYQYKSEVIKHNGKFYFKYEYSKKEIILPLRAW